MKYVWICHQPDSSDLFRGYGPTLSGGLINCATLWGDGAQVEHEVQR